MYKKNSYGRAEKTQSVGRPETRNLFCVALLLFHILLGKSQQTWWSSNHMTALTAEQMEENSTCQPPEKKVKRSQRNEQQAEA